jgi:hypothetical protein
MPVLKALAVALTTLFLLALPALAQELENPSVEQCPASAEEAMAGAAAATAEESTAEESTAEDTAATTESSADSEAMTSTQLGPEECATPQQEEASPPRSLIELLPLIN